MHCYACSSFASAHKHDLAGANALQFVSVNSVCAFGRLCNSWECILYMILLHSAAIDPEQACFHTWNCSEWNVFKLPFRILINNANKPITFFSVFWSEVASIMRHQIIWTDADACTRPKGLVCTYRYGTSCLLLSGPWMHANEGFWRSRKVAIVRCEVEFLTLLEIIFCYALQIGSHAQIAQIHAFYFNKFFVILILSESTFSPCHFMNFALTRV
jgi:hypothetical protein